MAFDISSLPGIIGAVTGPAGIFIAYISLRRANTIKSMDLRIETKIAHNSLPIIFKELRDLSIAADQSRKALAATTGRTKSGFMEKWTLTVSEIKKAEKLLQNRYDNLLTEYENMNLGELESQLIEIRQIERELIQLINKFKGEMAADDKQRERIDAYTRAAL